VQWIVDTDQPLDVVESATFRYMTSALVFNPRHANTFDRFAIEEHIESQIKVMRDIIRELLADCSIVHVQEYWKSAGKHSYQVDRAHWIDSQFKLRNVALACDHATTASQGETNDALWKPIGVDFQKQVPVTVGNNAVTLYAGSAGSPLFHGLEYELQQIAKVAFLALGPDIGKVLQKVRGLVQKMESSSLVREALAKAQADLKSFYSSEQVDLILDAIEDSWWSIQEMIVRLLYLRKALEYLLLDARLQDEIDHLTRREWDLLEQLQMVWEPLNIAPQLLQKQKFVTISLVPIILQIIAEDLMSFHGQDGIEPQVAECITQMTKVWDDRYGKQFPSKPFQGLDTTIWLAHVLDPRFKTLHVFKSSSTSDEIIFKALLEKMVEIRLQDKPKSDDDAEATSVEKVEESAGTSSSPQKKKQAPASANMGFRMFASSRSSLSGGSKRGLQRLSERFSFNSKLKKESDDDGDDAERNKVKEECQTEIEDYE
jgi:hypothetical protein